MSLIFNLIFAGILVAKIEAVVLGQNADIEDYKFMAVLLRDGSAFCDGSIFNKDWILTAAHCVAEANNDPVSTTGLKVKVGSTTVSGTSGQTVSVVLIKVHPQRSSVTNDYDVAMLKLETPLEYNDAVNFIPMVNYAVPDKSKAIVLGWGTVLPVLGVIQANRLKKAQMDTINQEECNNAFSGGVTDRMICAKGFLGLVSACYGDSGGPLVLDDEQIGVVSFGQFCSSPFAPVVFGNTFTLRQFIFDIGGSQY